MVQNQNDIHMCTRFNIVLDTQAYPNVLTPSVVWKNDVIIHRPLTSGGRMGTKGLKAKMALI